MSSDANSTKSILLVDDHPIFRKGLYSLLEDEEDMLVVGEAGDGKTALELVEELSPDIVVMDVTMPGLNGIEATKRIVAEFPGTLVVALSIHSEKQFVQDMLRAGASGYILKETVPEDLVKGIRSVMLGEGYLSPAITGLVVSQLRESVTEKQLFQVAKEQILETKLHPPQAPQNHICRSNLLKLLETNRNLPLQTVTAPAGYGKSLLVSCWVLSHEWPCSWISLDEDDRDLRQFLRYFVHAIKIMFPDALTKFVGLLEAVELPPLQVIVTSLVNEISSIENDFILVLDDFHVIKEKKVHDLLAELLRHPPKPMHLILIGRSDPFLPIAGFRAQGLIAEIRLRDLRFTEKETEEFLQDILHQKIDESVCKDWSLKTEGWITGLRLLALSIHQREDLNNLFLELERSGQFVRDYLFNEVLVKQPEDIREYLLMASILKRFSGELLDVLCPNVENTSEIGGWEFLRWLKQNNMFLISLDKDDQWFRFHHFFQELLKKELENSLSPDQIAKLHAKASKWFEEKGLVDEAIKHALASGDLNSAAQIVEHYRFTLLDTDQWQTLKRVLDRFPYEFKQGRIELLLTQAWILQTTARVAEIAPIVERIETLLDEKATEPVLLAEINFFRGLLCYFGGKGALSLEFFVKARELLPEQFFIALRASVEYWNAVALHFVGQKEIAIQELHEKLRESKFNEGMMLSRLTFGLCFIHMLDAECVQASQEGMRMGEVCRTNRFLFAETWSMYVQGNASFQMFDLDSAQHYFSLVMENRYIANPRVAVDAMAGLAMISQFMGKADQADETMRLAQVYVQWLQELNYQDLILSCQARLALLRGDHSSAFQLNRSLAETSGDAMTLFFLEIPSITQCRLLIAKDSVTSLKEAMERLKYIQQKCKAWQNTCQMIDVLVLRALASNQQGKLGESLDILTQAVAMAEPGEFIRPFLELGAPMEDLLEKLSEQNVVPDYTRTILAAIKDNSGRTALGGSHHDNLLHTQNRSLTLVDHLTSREQEILNQLAKGAANKKIAETLFISIDTVKTHLKNIYQKLDVNSRLQAVTIAKDKGLVGKKDRENSLF